MNAPQGSSEAVAVAPGTPPQAPNVPPTFADQEALLAAMEKDPALFEQVQNDIAAYNTMQEQGVLETPAEQPPTPPVAPAAQEQPPVEGQPPAAPAEEKVQPIELTGKVDPRLLGSYAANRTPAEAVEAMAKAAQEYEGQVGFYKKTRIPSLEAERDEALTKMQEMQTELERLKAGGAPQAAPAASAAPQPLPAAPTPVPAVPPTPAPQAIEIPELPPEPVPPEYPIGDDAYNEAKISEWQTKQKDYYRDLKAYNDTRDRRTEAMLRAQEQSYEQKYGTLQKTFTDRLSQIENQVQSVNAERQTNAQAQALAREYDAINELRSHPEYAPVLGGESGRDIRDIEADFINFTQNLGVVAGIKGGIYETVRTARGVEQTNRFRPEVVQALKDYNDPNSPRGQQLRGSCLTQHIEPPADMDVYNKVSYVRNVCQTYGKKQGGKVIPLAYDEGAAFAKALRPDLFAAAVPAPAAQPPQPVQPGQPAPFTRREVAVNKQNAYATEVHDGNAGTAGVVAAEELGPQNLGRILAIAKEARTEHDLAVLKTAAEHLGVPVEQINI